MVMKRIIVSIFITVTILLVSCNVFSQSKDDVYFVFTSIDTIKPGFVYRDNKVNLNPKTSLLKEQPVAFIFEFEKGHGVLYWHFFRVNLKYGEKEVDEMDKHLVIEKPISFLDTVEYYDWDNIKGYEYLKWEPIANKYILNKNVRVFLIDRQDIKDGKIKLYQVQDMTTKLFLLRDSVIVIS